MTVFELLGISQGDAITVDNPWSDYGERQMIPLSISKNGISIRAIDTRHGDIRYIAPDWTIITDAGDRVLLKDFPYISQNLKSLSKQKQSERRPKESKREVASMVDVLDSLKLNGLNVVITGTLPIPRADFKKILEDKGSNVFGGISKKIDLLIMGDTGAFEITSKMKKAQELGIKIVTVSG